MSEAPATAAVVTPGKLLRDARVKQQLDTEEVASSLNWLPEYVHLIEQDRYDELRRPTFARGYVKAYARLVGVADARIRRALDEWSEAHGQAPDDVSLSRREIVEPPKSAMGMVIGVAMLGLVLVALWWWQGGDAANPVNEMSVQSGAVDPESIRVAPE